METNERREPDGYDDAVAILTEKPDAIEDAWRAPDDETPRDIAFAHCLFLYADETGNGNAEPIGQDDSKFCGCLIMIRRPEGFAVAQTPELTKAIIEDDRIPDDETRVRPEHLPVFAEWQRRLDKALGRTPPPRMASAN